MQVQYKEDINYEETSSWIHEETSSSPAGVHRGNQSAELWSLSATDTKPSAAYPSEMINIIAPSWRVIPATNMIDKIRKDPQLKKKICFNPYMYRGNLALQIGCKLLSVSLDIKKSLHEVRSSPSVRPPHATLVAWTFPLDRRPWDFYSNIGTDDVVTDRSGSKLLHNLKKICLFKMKVLKNVIQVEEISKVLEISGERSLIDNFVFSYHV